MTKTKMTNESMSGFTAEDLTEVFSMLQEAGWDAVLVGGQAVNLESISLTSFPPRRCARDGFDAFLAERLPRLLDDLARKRKRHLEAMRACE